MVSGLGPNYAGSCQRVKYSGYMRPLPVRRLFAVWMDISRREIPLFAFQRSVSLAVVTFFFSLSLFFFFFFSFDLPISRHYELILDGREMKNRSRISQWPDRRAIKFFRMPRGICAAELRLIKGRSRASPTGKISGVERGGGGATFDGSRATKEYRKPDGDAVKLPRLQLRNSSRCDWSLVRESI